MLGSNEFEAWNGFSNPSLSSHLIHHIYTAFSTLLERTLPSGGPSLPQRRHFSKTEKEPIKGNGGKQFLFGWTTVDFIPKTT
jgi:hypothetical protein